MSQDHDDGEYMTPEAWAELGRQLASQPPREDSEFVRLMRSMIANGHLMEAAEYAKSMMYVPVADLRGMLAVLADAIIDPSTPKRKRGDKYSNRMTFEKLVAEVTLAKKVRDAISAREARTNKAHSKKVRNRNVENALLDVAKDRKLGTSVGTAKRRYYKHKPTIPAK